MSLFGAAANLIGDIGFGVIKNTGRIALGGGKTILGVITEDDTLIEEGVGQMGKGAFFLASSAAGNAIFEGDNAENDQSLDDCDV